MQLHKILETITVKKKIVPLIKDNTFHFVSFPKSGRTWIRMFLNHYFFNLYPFSVMDRNNERFVRLIPEVIFDHKMKFNTDIKSLEMSVEKSKSKNIILLIRDPRDIFVSYYFHMTKRKKAPFKRFLINWDTISMEELIRDDNHGIRGIVRYMNYWYQAHPKFKTFFLLQYENLKNNTAAELKRLMCFLKEEINYPAFDKALEETSFKKMKRAEKEGLYGDFELSAKNINDEESYKVRKGEVGGYMNYLKCSEIEYAQEAMNDLHPHLKDRFDILMKNQKL